jgi:hypothetical protein
MCYMKRVSVHMRIDPKVLKDAQKEAGRVKLSFGRMNEYLWRAYLYPDAVTFWERVKKLVDAARAE